MCTQVGEKTVIPPRFDSDTWYPASTMYKDRTTLVQCFLYFAENGDKNLATLEGFWMNAGLIESSTVILG